MVDQLRDILDQELGILSRLLELADSLTCNDAIEQSTLDEAVHERQTLLERLSDLERQALDLRGSTDTPEQLTDKVGQLKALAAKVEQAETNVTAHLDKVLSGLRDDAAMLANGKRSIEGYGGPVSHLSRFTDRKG